MKYISFNDLCLRFFLFPKTVLSCDKKFNIFCCILLFSYNAEKLRCCDDDLQFYRTGHRLRANNKWSRRRSERFEIRSSYIVFQYSQLVTRNGQETMC